MTHHRALDSHAPAIRALHEASADDPSARGALRLGLWAGRQLGLAEGPLALYAFAVMDAPQAVARVAADLAERGLSIQGSEFEAMMTPRDASGI